MQASWVNVEDYLQGPSTKPSTFRWWLFGLTPHGRLLPQETKAKERWDALATCYPHGGLFSVVDGTVPLRS